VAGDDSSEATEPVMLHLSPDHVRRLDDLRRDRNMSRTQLIEFLLDHVKERPRRRVAGERQRANPWGQVWPG
jgi:hypothetical protein